MPHYDKIQASFGSHDISHVQAYTGREASAASAAIGAQAYVTGSRIALPPDMSVVPHEASHQ